MWHRGRATGPETDMEGFFQRLKDLYDRMDRAYQAVADRYAFDCLGCDDNCCSQKFHHHTYIEEYYLVEGLKKADPELKEQIGKRLRDYKGGGTAPPCPVNFEGLCSLHEWRPMICRLHGMPYVMRMPDGALVTGDGCGRFQGLYKPEIKLERTPFYAELAMLEREFRQKSGITAPYKKTTAEMLGATASRDTGGAK